MCHRLEHNISKNIGGMTFGVSSTGYTSYKLTKSFGLAPKEHACCYGKTKQ